MAFLTRILDRIYDRLNNTETARAYDEQGHCIAVLRLPKGYTDAIGCLADVMKESAPDDVEIVKEYED
jgi:hypothetical protein